ncbi:MAG: hypothetical protein E6559_11735 [Pantoea sp.]|nr:hypothetical protein [Pantoea septica]MDU5836090.1 hypothetical protein [Pantoea sp.]MDU6440564.1 hypothetical protein [Pantoea sp.]
MLIESARAGRWLYE